MLDEFDITPREIDDLIKEIQNEDLELVLIKERLRREALEKLVIALIDQVNLLETKLRQHNLFHNFS
jgi:hypothetical protein